MEWLRSLFSRPTAPLRTFQAGAAVLALAATFVGGWEGYDPVAKHHSFDPPGVITIGNGITTFDMPGLKAGMKCGKDVDCKAKFTEAMGRYDTMLMKHITTPLPPHRHVALISLTYNLGPGNIAKMAQPPGPKNGYAKVIWYINHGQTRKGCDAILKWTGSHNNLAHKGLVNRRKAEREWCLRDD